MLDAIGHRKITQRRCYARVDRDRLGEKLSLAKENNSIPGKVIGVTLAVLIPVGTDLIDGGWIERNRPTVTGSESQKPWVDEHDGGPEGDISGVG